MVTPESDSTDISPTNLSNEDEFVRLFVKYQRVLFVFLRTALGNPIDAEEVLQETSVILWRDRQQFVLGTNFVNWATTVAQNQVHRFRRSRKHNLQAFDEGLFDQMAAEMAAHCDLVEARRRALEQCLQLLNERDRNLINATYGAKVTKKAIGEGLGMNPDMFYKVLKRIRQRLLKCIQQRLTTEGLT